MTASLGSGAAASAPACLSSYLTAAVVADLWPGQSTSSIEHWVEYYSVAAITRTPSAAAKI